MNPLREYIRKEIKRLSEDNLKSYPIPHEIRGVLENPPHKGGLGLTPLKRYVATLKAPATVPPSYRVFFINNQYIDCYMEQIGIKVIINNKSFWIHDVREANEAIQELNRVLTQPIPSTGEESDEGGEEDMDTGGGDDSEMEPEAEDEGGGEEEA